MSGWEPVLKLDVQLVEDQRPVFNASHRFLGNVFRYQLEQFVYCLFGVRMQVQFRNNALSILAIFDNKQLYQHYFTTIRARQNPESN